MEDLELIPCLWHHCKESCGTTGFLGPVPPREGNGADRRHEALARSRTVGARRWRWSVYPLVGEGAR